MDVKSLIVFSQNQGVSHLSVRRSVDDVIHRGRRGENGHISSFEMLDPITELGPIQTRHHDGVDQLAWEQEGGVGGDKACHSARWLAGMCYGQIVILGIKPAHSQRVMLCDTSGYMEKAT